MKTVRKVHCFFEQSGVFKNEFRKLSVDAYDYDIENNFGQTDYVLDIFNHIDEEIHGVDSFLFGDRITGEDLIIAFFPCIYFCEFNDMFFCGTAHNYKKLLDSEKINKIIERSEQRQFYYRKVLELIYICEYRNYRLIIENPYSAHHYWRYNFPKYPRIIDMDRTTRGDCYKKPTQYIFVNCEPETNRISYQRPKEVRYIYDTKSSDNAGECSVERSMLTSEYAHNFICDYVLGIPSGNNMPTLFQ